MSGQDARYTIFEALRKPIAWLFKTDDEHATIYRLFNSKHVQDLQLIIGVSSLVVLVIGIVGLGLATWKVQQSWLVSDTALKCLKYGGTVLVVFGGVVSWAYKTGSSRLGVVDLFACEISTLCRVITVVEAVQASINRVDHLPAQHSNGGKLHAHDLQHFTSQEDYFPVFATNNQALQTLEAEVVIQITAFYTFMKSFRDSLRALAEISSATAEANDQRAHDAWRAAAGRSVYMLFLGLESARCAIEYLVEYEPEKAEQRIVILLSELEAFEFLRHKYRGRDDIYDRRIELRVPKYREVVPALVELVESKFQKSPTADWERAYLLLEELQRRYDSAVSHFRDDGRRAVGTA